MKYRDFIFRKMFEKHNREGRVTEIVRNVREMTHLDSRCVPVTEEPSYDFDCDVAGSMFLSRTVAAEVCMECRTNEAGYTALKTLDGAGDLLFELKDLVHDLLKVFLRRTWFYPLLNPPPSYFSRPVQSQPQTQSSHFNPSFATSLHPPMSQTRLV